MNPIQIMESRKDKFTPNDMQIYETIIKNPAHIVRMTTSTLAEECGVSQPALSRFIKSLGYARYQDFRTDMVTWMSKKSEEEAEGSNHLAYFYKIHELLDEVEPMLTADYMKNLADYIKQFNRIFTTGAGKSFQPAELFEILMFKTLRYTHVLRRDRLIEAADYMNEDDLLIIFSVSAKPYIMKDAVGTNAKILLVTTNPDHQYKDEIDRDVILPYVPPDPESSSVSPVLFDMFVELLVEYLMPEEH